MSNKWTDRIKNNEITPPESGWDKVVPSLDDSFIGHKFPATLYNIEVTPPAGAWNKIQSSLTKDPAPVVPIKSTSSFRSFVKYAAAASITGLLAFGAIRYFKIGTDKIDVAIGRGVHPAQTDTPAIDENKTAASKQLMQSQDGNDENAGGQNKNAYTRPDAPNNSLYSRINKHLYKSPVQLTTANSETAFQKDPELQYPLRAAINDLSARYSSDRYLLFKDSEGRFVRISKKLSGLYCCVSGEEQDEECSNKLKKWREKIASSSFVPAPDNFMDILDLVSSLQDSRN